jgi:aerobic carbon-monoxide dehydrogenase medium subunit
VIPAAVAYLRPAGIDEALNALADPEAKVLAGGHSLVPMMKLRLAHPSLLVDIGRLEFRRVGKADGILSIGALARYDDLLTLRDVVLPAALHEAASAVGDVQVRNAGTIGGSLAHGDPASDIAAAVLALGARLRLRSPSGYRECPAEEFFEGPFTTSLGQQELLVEIAVPSPRSGEGSAYHSIEDPASGYPLAGAAVKVRLEAGRVAECAVGLTGAASAPCRLAEVERALAQAPPDGVSAIVGEALAGTPLAVGAGSDEHRRHLAVVAITRAYQSARERAQRGERP